MIKSYNNDDLIETFISLKGIKKLIPSSRGKPINNIKPVVNRRVTGNSITINSNPLNTKQRKDMLNK